MSGTPPVAARTGTAIIPTGYYWVDFQIATAASGGIEFRDLVHIYRNMTSPLSRAFTAANLYLPSDDDGEAKIGGITYTHPGDPSLTIGWSSNPISGTGGEGSPAVFSRSTMNGLVISLSGAGTVAPGGYNWYYGGGPGTVEPLASNGSLTVNITKPPFEAVINGLEITLEIKTGTSPDFVPYTKIIYMTIQ